MAEERGRDLLLPLRSTPAALALLDIRLLPVLRRLSSLPLVAAVAAVPLVNNEAPPLRPRPSSLKGLTDDISINGTRGRDFDRERGAAMVVF